MCSSYQSVKAENLARFGRGQPDFEYAAECYPERTAPFLANAHASWLEGSFGLLPHWAKPHLARQTYNARAETVAERSSYRNAWRRRQLAIIPVQAFFEPNYETGQAVRWRIERCDGQPFGLAGIWERRTLDDGTDQLSFSMLTINADEHPLMRRFHAPGKEKRSVVVLADDAWDPWLTARADDEIRAFLKLVDSDLLTAACDPLPRRRNP